MVEELICMGKKGQFILSYQNIMKPINCVIINSIIIMMGLDFIIKLERLILMYKYSPQMVLI